METYGIDCLDCLEIISLNDGQTVASIEIVPRSDDEDTDEVFGIINKLMLCDTNNLL